jgi:hypothetical protein
MQPLILLFFLFGGIFPAAAQTDKGNFIIPKTNSRSTAVQTIAATKIEISYNRPNKRGREIFGKLVPFGQVWRTGSDEATELYFSIALKLAGNTIDSGRYELFTIPGKDKWEIILQKNKNQWGSYRYDAANDVARFSVTPAAANKITETFTISIDQVGSDNGVLNICWDNVVVPIEIKIDLRATVVPGLEKALSAAGRRPYFNAAMFYFENDIDINRAAELMSLALEQNPGHIGMLYRQALILKRKGDIKEAIQAAENSLAGAQKADAELKAEYTGLNTALLEELKAMKH